MSYRKNRKIIIIIIINPVFRNKYGLKENVGPGTAVKALTHPLNMHVFPPTGQVMILHILILSISPSYDTNLNYYCK